MSHTATTPAEAQVASVATAGQTIRVIWGDGKTDGFYATWLRDNCPCPDCRHPDNAQRLFDITDLPDDLRVAAAELCGAGQIELVFAPEGHVTRFDARWLRARGDAIAGRRPEPEPRLWDRTLAAALPTARYTDVAEDTQARAAWLRDIVAYGFAILTGVPVVSGTVTDVARMFGHVRETNYGSFFDVRSEAEPTNLAYTNRGLPVHTDNPYRDPVPGLQLLHCLANDAPGGDTIVVDGFHAAEILRREAPEAFTLLVKHGVPFHFRDVSTDLRARAPLIELDDADRVVAVRYNNRSAAPIDVPAAAMADFYAAYRRFAEILKRRDLRVEFVLTAGALLVVGNRRVLHGRSAFEATSGQRHLQGCYADHDGLLSTLRLLESRT